MRLKGLDLNLLIALNVLIEERSVSGAAKRLYLSQPAASAALRRLRDYFKDELLVLHGKRMLPTSYAQSLLPELKRIIAQVDGLIAMSAEFDSATSERIFKLMASDYITTVLITPAAAKFEKTAPNIKLDVRLSGDAVRTEFERGEIDLILVPEEFLAPEHPAELLFEEPHVIVGWRENPILGHPITEKEFFEAKHVGVRLGPTRDPTFTERQIEALRKPRTLDVIAPNFSVVPWLLLGTNRLAVMQMRLARAYEQVLPLRTAPLPFDFPPMRLMLQFHSVRASDKGVLWLIDQFHETAKEVVAGDIAAYAAKQAETA